MNEELIKLYRNSKYTVKGFAQVLGISRTRLYNVLNKKQILGERTFHKYKVKLTKHQNKLTKKRKLIYEFTDP